MSKYQWIKTVVATASMFVFSVTLANTDSMTTASTNSNPYTYADSVSSAANPSYTSVGQPVQNEANSLTLNNQALGLGGPVSVTGGYSADYGYELQASFSHMIGLYDAISLLGAYAPQENRIDITWAHAWTEKQRTKLSVERLSEDMDFNYDSGSATEWVPQYSFGAGYQYLFNQNWLRNIELSGYYAQAQSQDLDTVRFESNGVTYDNYRHIAGAISQGTEATLNISPWKTGLLGLGLNYDSVNYDTKYEDTDAQDSKGFGFTLSLEQLLSKHVKLNFEGSQREVYDNYVAGVSFLTPSNLEVGFNGERTLGENGSSSDSRFNMSLAYFLDDHDRYQHGYSLEDVSQSDLASWASKSPAYMDEVIAAADQKTVVVVNSSPTPPQSTLQSTNNMPVISLTAGEINHVDISDYIASSSLTDAQKQAIPTIIGGPSDVEFTYDNATQSLNTKAEVPASAVNQTSAPLVLRFPADTTTLTTKVATTSEDQLSFSVTVGDSITPYLNSGFNQNLTAVQTHAQTWVLKYENVASPATSPQDSATMFINPNSAAKYLQIPSVTDTKYFQKSGDTNNCYATPIANNTQDASGQTLTLSSKAASNCPDNVTYKVKACNTSACSASFQTINITVQPATSPYIMGGAVPNLMESSSYSYAIPNSGDTGPMASPGEGQTFQSAQLKVFNATGGCVDVTNDSNLELNMGTNQLTLQTKTGTSVPSSLVGDNLKIYMSITNNLGNTFDNGTTSNCQGDPLTASVVGGPVVPGNLNMGTATVDSSYTYNFTANGVTSGSSDFASGTATTKIANSDGTETPVAIADLGLSLDVQPKSVTMTGIPTATYAGDTIHVYLNLTNAQGYPGGNTEADFFTIAANNSEAPTVGTGNLAPAVVAQIYPGDTLTGTSPGANRSYENLNPTSNINEGTYVKVVDFNGNDVTNLMHVTLNANTQTLNLQSTGSAVDGSLASGTYYAYVHVFNDANVASSNCSTTDCNDLVGAKGTPYQIVVNSAYVPQPNNLSNTFTPTIEGQDYNYLYGTTPADSPMLAGPAGKGETFDTTKTTVSVVDTGNNNQVVPGFSLVFSADKTLITNLTAPASAIANVKGPLSVTYSAYNQDYDANNPNGQPVTATATNTIATDAINVTATSLPAGTVGTTYPTYSFKTSGGLTVGSTGLSPDTSLGGLSSATFSDPNAGLTAIVQNNDVIVSGTPVAGHAGTLTLTLNLKTPDGLLTKISTATLVINATAPTVIPGNLTSAQLNQSYRYDFANTGSGGASGPVVSAGAGEYFDEDSVNGTTFTVTGSSSGNMTSQFHLEYSGNATMMQGNGSVNNHHNLVSLVSNGTLTTSETLTVTFHVVNVDAQHVDGTPGTISVGSVPGYLYCPSGESVFSRPAGNPAVTSGLYNAPTAGTLLTNVGFASNGAPAGGSIQLYSASITNNQLTCNYIIGGVAPTSYAYVATATVPVDAVGYGAGWSGNGCSVDYRNTQATADKSCQVTYSYTG